VCGIAIERENFQLKCLCGDVLSFKFMKKQFYGKVFDKLLEKHFLKS
jgi:hypothetical protein